MQKREFTKLELASQTASEIGWSVPGVITYFYKLGTDEKSVEVIVWSNPPMGRVAIFETPVLLNWYEIEIYNFSLKEFTSDFESETKTTLKFYYEEKSEDEKTEAHVLSHEKYLELCIKENLNSNQLKAV